MIGDETFQLLYYLGKIALLIFSFLHFMLLLVILRQVNLGDSIMVIAHNKPALLFGLVHAIILLVILVIIVALPS